MLLQAPRRQGKPRRRQPVSSFQYRNAPASGHIAEGKLLVIEPGETWTSQVKDITSHHLFIDSAWLQQFATEQLHWEQPLPHFPSQTFSDSSLSRTVHDLVANSLAPASRLQQEELLLRLFAPLLQVHVEDARTLPQLGREHPAVKRVKEYLQAYYAQEVSLGGNCWSISFQHTRCGPVFPDHFSPVLMMRGMCCKLRWEMMKDKRESL